MSIAEPQHATVLIVDDVAANRIAFEAALEPLGYQLVIASSGEEALRLLLSEEFACILLDVQMPGLDGFATARLIRHRAKTRVVPILFVTAMSREEAHIIRGYSEGCVDYVLKPVSPELLRAKVSVVVANFLREREAMKRADGLSLRLREEEQRVFEAQRQALHTAETERRRLYSLFTEAPFPVAVLRGPSLRVELVNDKVRMYFGQLSMGQPIADAVPSLRTNGHLPLLQEAYATGKAQVITEAPVREVGASPEAPPVYLTMLYQPIHGEDGTVEGVLACGFDVTAAVNAREVMKTASLEAKNALKLRDDFLAVASHELKTPLAALVMRLQSVLRRPDLGMNPLLQEPLKLAKHQAERLAALVDGLMDVSRLANGRMHLELEEQVNFADVVREVTSRFQTHAHKLGSVLSVDAPPQLCGRWDRLRLEQIVTNLLSNALKYGAGKPVELSLGEALGNARLIVKDRGIGIPKEALGRIFEKFERAVSDRNYGGLGLGLFITREIVRAMSGTVSVTAAEAGGTVFVVELPQAVERDAQTTPDATAPLETPLG
ncbi:MAG: ATP-binding protein [Myxococcaceae bacterium]